MAQPQFIKKDIIRKKVGYFQICNKSYPVYEGINIIGRYVSSTILLKEAKFSRMHAMITVINEDQHFISDNNSSNGTWLENERLTPYSFYKLKDTSKITIGDVVGIYRQQRPPSVRDKRITGNSANTVIVVEDIHIAPTQLIGDIHEAETQVSIQNNQRHEIQKQLECENNLTAKQKSIENNDDIDCLSTQSYDDILANESFRLSLLENNSRCGQVVDETIMSEDLIVEASVTSAETSKTHRNSEAIIDEQTSVPCKHVKEKEVISEKKQLLSDSDTDIDEEIVPNISKLKITEQPANKYITEQKHTIPSLAVVRRLFSPTNVLKSPASTSSDSETDIEELLKFHSNNVSENQNVNMKCISDSDTDMEENVTARSNEVKKKKVSTSSETDADNENDKAVDDIDLLNNASTLVITNKSLLSKTNNEISLLNENSSEEFDLLSAPNFGLTESDSTKQNTTKHNEEIVTKEVHNICIDTAEKDKVDNTSDINKNKCITENNGSERDADILHPTQFLNPSQDMPTGNTEKASGNHKQGNAFEKNEEIIDCIALPQILHSNKKEHKLEATQILNICEERDESAQKNDKNDIEKDLKATQIISNCKENCSAETSKETLTSTNTQKGHYEVGNRSKTGSDIYIQVESSCEKCKNKDKCLCYVEENVTANKVDITSTENKSDESSEMFENDLDFDLLPTQKLILPNYNNTNNIQVDENVIEVDGEDVDVIPATPEFTAPTEKLLVRNVSQINNDTKFLKQGTNICVSTEDDVFLAPTQKLIISDSTSTNTNVTNLPKNVNSNNADDSMFTADTQKLSPIIAKVDSEQRINRNLEDDRFESLPPTQILPTNNTSEQNKKQKFSTFSLNINNATSVTNEPLPSTSKSKPLMRNLYTAKNVSDDVDFLAPTQKFMLHSKTTNENVDNDTDSLPPTQILTLSKSEISIRPTFPLRFNTNKTKQVLQDDNDDSLPPTQILKIGADLFPTDNQKNVINEFKSMKHNLCTSNKSAHIVHDNNNDINIGEKNALSSINAIKKLNTDSLQKDKVNIDYNEKIDMPTQKLIIENNTTQTGTSVLRSTHSTNTNYKNDFLKKEQKVTSTKTGMNSTKKRKSEDETTPTKKQKLTTNKSNTRTRSKSGARKSSTRKLITNSDKNTDESSKMSYTRKVKAVASIDYSLESSTVNENKNHFSLSTRRSSKSINQIKNPCTKLDKAAESNDESNLKQTTSESKYKNNEASTSKGIYISGDSEINRHSRAVQTINTRSNEILKGKKETIQKQLPENVNNSSDESERSIVNYIKKKVIKIDYTDDSETKSTDSNSCIFPRRSRRAMKLSSSSEEESKKSETNLIVKKARDTSTKKTIDQSCKETPAMNTLTKRTRKSVEKSGSSEERLTSPRKQRSENVCVLETNSEEETPTKRRRYESVNDTATRSTPKSHKHRVAFTMINDPALEDSVINLDGRVVESIKKCTVLVTDKITRSLKFLMAVALNKPIVGLDWITESENCYRFLDPWNYILQDTETEKRNNFTLKQALQRSASKKLLLDYTIVLAVSKNAGALKEIIQSCGGKCVTKITSKRSGSKIIVVSYAEDKAKYSKYLSQKPPLLVVAAEAIFAGALTQKLIWNEYVLE